MLTPLAHHLSAARVPLYWHGAHRTSLDVLSLHLPYPHAEVSHLPALLDKEGPVLRAGEAGVPAGRAEAAELLDAGGAGDGHALGLGAGTDVADGVTPSAGAPRTVCVQGNFCRESINIYILLRSATSREIYSVLVASKKSRFYQRERSENVTWR